MKAFIPSILVLVLASAPLIARILLPEQPVSAPVFEPVDVMYHYFRVASDGDGFLAVFPGVGAVRFDVAGKPLDVPSITLPFTTQFFSGDVIWTGTEYVAGWLTYERTIRLVTISREGKVGAPIDLPVESGGTETIVRLAWNGRRLAVAWQNAPIAYLLPTPPQTPAQDLAVKIAIVGSDGSIHQTGRIEQPQPLREFQADGSGFAVLTNASIELVSGEGKPGATIVLDGGSHDFEVDGNQFIVLNGSRYWYYAYRPFLRAVGRDGTIRWTRVLPAAGEAGAAGSLTREGSEFIAAWKTVSSGNLGAVNIGRFSADGEMLQRAVPGGAFESVSPNVSGGGLEVELASNGSQSVLVWIARPARDYSSLVAMPLGRELVGEITPISTHAVEQAIAGAVDTGSEYVVAWIEKDRLLARRVTDRGEQLDGEGKLLAEERGIGNAHAGFDGEAIVIIWNAEGGVFMQRFDRSLTAAGPRVRISEEGARLDSFVCARESCLASWRDARNRFTIARIQKGGVLVPVEIPMREVVIAASDDSFLLVSSRGVEPTGGIISAAVIPAEGAASPAFHDIVALPYGFTDGPWAVWDGARWAVLWGFGSSPGGGLRMTRLDRDGNSLDGDLTQWGGFVVHKGTPFLSGLWRVGDMFVMSAYGETLVMHRETLRVESEAFLAYGFATRFGSRGPGRGIMAYARDVANDRYFRSTRSFFRLMAPPPRQRTTRR